MSLQEALRLAVLVNLDIAQAQQVVKQAQANRERALALWLPNIGNGATYVDHEGRIQNTNGNVLNVNRNSLFVGTIPTVSFSLSDALFTPRVSEQILAASRAGQQRVTNETLLAVAESYFAVVRGFRRVARVEETLEDLTSDQVSAKRGDSKGLLPIITTFVKEGDAPPQEQARVEVEVVRRRDEGVSAVQELRVAMAELSRLLRLDPQILIWPTEDYTQPLPIPGDPWFHASLEELVVFAINSRPDLAENQAQVQATLERLRAARWRPLLPNVIVNYNAGGFGGSPVIIGRRGNTDILGRDGRIDNWGGRTDFEVGLYWRLQNMGFGNDAERREQRAIHDQATLRAVQTRERVVAQVVQAVELLERSKERMKVLGSGLFDSEGRRAGPVYRGLRLNFLRMRLGQSRPLETLDSIRGLSDILESYAIALTEYDRSRFRLLIALGMPAGGIVNPQCMPLPVPRTEGAPPQTTPAEIPVMPRAVQTPDYPEAPMGFKTE